MGVLVNKGHRLLTWSVLPFYIVVCNNKWDLKLFHSKWNMYLTRLFWALDTRDCLTSFSSSSSIFTVSTPFITSSTLWEWERRVLVVLKIDIYVTNRLIVSIYNTCYAIYHKEIALKIIYILKAVKPHNVKSYLIFIIWPQTFYLCVSCRLKLPDFLLMFLAEVSLQFGDLFRQLFPLFLVVFGDCIFHALDFGWQWSTRVHNLTKQYTINRVKVLDCAKS